MNSESHAIFRTTLVVASMESARNLIVINALAASAGNDFPCRRNPPTFGSRIQLRNQRYCRADGPCHRSDNAVRWVVRIEAKLTESLRIRRCPWPQNSRMNPLYGADKSNTHHKC